MYNVLYLREDFETMFLLSFWLFVTIVVPYFLFETLTSVMRGRKSEGEVSEKALKKLIRRLARQLRRENVSIKTTTRLVRRLSRQIRRRNAHIRPRRQIQSHLTDTNTKNSTSESYLPETTDQIPNENDLVSRLNLPQSNIDRCLTLSTDPPNTPENTVLFGLTCYGDDTSVAMEIARVYDTMVAAVNTYLYRHISFDSPRRHGKDAGQRTGTEVVVFRPQRSHGMTLDLSLACDVARMYQAIPAGPTYIDYTRLTNIKIPNQFFVSLGSLGKIIADETEVDSPSCQQHATPITSQPKTRKEATAENEYQTSQTKLSFLYDDDVLGQRSRYTPRELVKFEEPSEVADSDLDLYQFEGWEVTDMLATNETNFGYQSTFNEAMTEYTTVLLKEDTAEYRQRWERACRLADEIEAEKKAEKENQAKLPKKRKRKSRRPKKLQYQ